MAVIRPFRGLRYDVRPTLRMHELVCPPYDVVDEEHRKKLVALSKWNLIRVELPQEKPSIAATDVDYERAARTLHAWEQEGVLVREARPVLYPYAQTFTGPDGKRRERRGFLCALRVEDYDGGAVRPHEKTLPKPKEDRFKLLQAAQTNVSPVFGLYDDKDGRVSEALAKAFVDEPLYEFVDDKGIEHRVWRIESGEAIGAVRSALAQSRIYIADGHHRYETALRYRDHRREQSDPHVPAGSAPYDYALAYLADVRDSGLAIFPIHRLAKPPEGMTDAALRESLERFFSIEELAVDHAAPSETIATQLESAIQTPTRREKLFALYWPKKKIAWLLRSKDALASFLQSSGVPKPVAALDVAVLHRAILEETLHASYADGTVHFAHSGSDAVKIALGQGTGAGDKGGFEIALLLNATKVQDLLSVVDAGETMPQKSTFFYPKPATGIVMNRLDSIE